MPKGRIQQGKSTGLLDGKPPWVHPGQTSPCSSPAQYLWAVTGYMTPSGSNVYKILKRQGSVLAGWWHLEKREAFIPKSVTGISSSEIFSTCSFIFTENQVKTPMSGLSPLPKWDALTDTGESLTGNFNYKNAYPITEWEQTLEECKSHSA